jgi:hypothetical protein
MTKLTPRPQQEEAIDLALSQIGTSNGILIGDEPGAGKTLIGVEFVLQAMRLYGWKRVLIIGLADTHAQWSERLLAQSDGAVEARIMNGTKAGREQYEAFMKHEPGVYVASSHFLVEKDWESEPQFSYVTQPDNSVKKWPLFKVVKKTGLMELKPRPEAEWVTQTVFPPSPAEWTARTEVIAKPAMIGPAAEPVRVRKSVRKGVFARFTRKPLDAVLFDEVHAIANRKSHGRQTILSIKAGYRMAMSGTWFLNSPANMWSITRWVWPGVNPATGLPYVETAFDRWKKQFMEIEEVRGKGGKVLETARGAAITKVTGERNPGEFVRTLPAYRRIENEDRVPEPLIIEVDPTPVQAAQMEELKADLMTWVMGWDGEEAPLVVDMPMILRMRLRQIAVAELSLDAEGKVYFTDDAKSAKLGPLRYLLEERWAGQQVGIYLESKIGAHFVTQRMQRAGASARAWTGDLSKPERAELKRAFIAGEFQYLIGTIQSMGTGIDGLQTVCNKVAWIQEADGNPALNDQAIARYFRPGRTLENGGFEHVKIIMRNSVDVESMQTLVNKAWAMRTAMNGGQKAA